MKRTSETVYGLVAVLLLALAVGSYGQSYVKPANPNVIGLNGGSTCNGYTGSKFSLLSRVESESKVGFDAFVVPNVPLPRIREIYLESYNDVKEFSLHNYSGDYNYWHPFLGWYYRDSYSIGTTLDHKTIDHERWIIPTREKTNILASGTRRLDIVRGGEVVVEPEEGYNPGGNFRGIGEYMEESNCLGTRSNGVWDTYCDGPYYMAYPPTTNNVLTNFISRTNLAYSATASGSGGGFFQNLPYLTYWCSSVSVSKRSSRTAWLKDEYTAPMLVGAVQGKIDALGYPTNESGGIIYESSGSQISARAFAQLSEDQYTISAGDAMYELEVEAAPGVKISVTYYQVTKRYYFVEDKAGLPASGVQAEAPDGLGGMAGGVWYMTLSNSENTIVLTGAPGTGSKQTIAGQLKVPSVGGNNYYTEVSLSMEAGKLPEQPCFDVPGSGLYCAVPYGGMVLKNDSVSIRADLGRDTNGLVAGYLYVKEELPVARLYSPESLKLVADTNTLTITRDGSGAIETITSGNGYLAISATNNLGYTMKFYALEAGLPATNEAPFVSYWIQNATGVATNYSHLRITETRGASSTTNEFQWVTNNQAWALIEGNGLRKTIKKITYSPDNVYRYERMEILNPDDSVASKQMRKYLRDARGELVVEEVVGEGLSALVKSYEYDASGWVTQVNEANGSWTIYEYDAGGRVTRTYAVFQNQGPTTTASLCRRVDYSYTPITGSGDDGTYQPNSARQVTEYLLGQEISRKYYVYKQYEERVIACPNPGLAWNHASNLVTITKKYDEGEYADYVKSVTNPDGTMAIYAYGTNTNFHKITTVYTGAPNEGGSAIVDGQKTITTQGPIGQTLTVVTKDVASDITISSLTYTNFDALNRPLKTIYLDGSYDTVSYSCCNVESQTDRHGITTTYGYDALKRQVVSTTLDISTMSVLDAAGRTLQSIRQGTNGTQIITSQSGYDTAGRLVASYDAYTNVTRYAYSTNGAGERLETVVLPDAAARTEISYRDGSTKLVEGTAVFRQRFESGVASDGGYWRRTAKSIKVLGDGTDSQEWTMMYTDGMGRSYKKAYADGAYEQSYYNGKGQVWKTRDADSVIMLMQYNSKGSQEYSGLDMDRDDVIDFDGTDRVTRSVTDVVSFLGVDSLRARSYVWNVDHADTALLVTESLQSVDGVRSWAISQGLTNTSWRVCDVTNAVCWVTNRTASGMYGVTKSLGNRVLQATQFDSNGVQVAHVSNVYDEFGRTLETVDAHAGATTYTYDLAGRVIAVQLPPSVTGGARQTLANVYDAVGRMIRSIKADGAVVTNEYHLTGQLKRTYGSRTYPVQYAYDYAGRMKTMTTWQDFAGNRGGAATLWSYDAQRGFMTAKRYADGKGTDYSYTSAGRLAGLTWARGTTVAYGHNNAGELVSVDYSDGTPDVTYAYNRVGQQAGLTDGFGGVQRTYHESGRLLTEQYTNGVLAGIVRTNEYDSLLRRSGLTVKTNATTLYRATYSYDAASRYQTISDGTNSATYSYVTNANLVNDVIFKQNGTARMTTTRQYDGLDRLTNLVSATVSFTSSSAYVYNEANQRTRQTREDGTYWVYGYDALGQVTSGKKYWVDGTEVKGMQYEYGFDDIGNRRETAKDGRESSYSANLLNQYAQRTVPGAMDVLGTARTNATVTVNGQSTYRKGGYFWSAVPFENKTAPVWGEVETLGIFRAGLTNDVVATNKGKVFLPQTPELYAYDVDGNLTGDGQWVYTWDAENRLVQMETKASAVAAGTPKQKLVYGYDYMSRRISKAVYLWSGGSYVLQSATLNQYDGWNLLAEFDVTATMVLSRTYLWGKDLSGSLEGVGGVGGLLAGTDRNAGTVSFVAYDGNGNVMALANANDGALAGSYEYGPFGEFIRLTGSAAANNPFRFSTKYQDHESGLLYYGYRYYCADTAKWLSRDPLNHKEVKRWGGAISMGFSPNSEESYGFCGNNPISIIDINGLVDYSNLNYLHDSAVAADFAGVQATPVEVYQGKTVKGAPIYMWREKSTKPNKYWCHGYTFGGAGAQGGPYSLYGMSVEPVLRDEGYKPVCCGMAQPGDLVIFFGSKMGLTYSIGGAKPTISQTGVSHSGIIVTAKINSFNNSFNEWSQLKSKQDSYGNLVDDTFERQAAAWGKYLCFSKQPLQGCCPVPGRSELDYSTYKFPFSIYGQ
jgi:RHS repeat-associated protein